MCKWNFLQLILIFYNHELHDNRFYDFYLIETTDVKDGPSIIEQPAVEIGTGPMIDRPREGLKIWVSI